MKKRIILPILLVLLSIAVIVACKKSKSGNPDCKFCKVHGPDLNIIDSAEVCTDADQAALQNKHPGREITCQ